MSDESSRPGGHSQMLFVMNRKQTKGLSCYYNKTWLLLWGASGFFSFLCFTWIYFLRSLMYYLVFLNLWLTLLTRRNKCEKLQNLQNNDPPATPKQTRLTQNSRCVSLWRTEVTAELMKSCLYPSSSIHPGSGWGHWGRTLNRDVQTSLSRFLVQIISGDTKAFQSQMRHIMSPGGTCLKPPVGSHSFWWQTRGGGTAVGRDVALL